VRRAIDLFSTPIAMGDIIVIEADQDIAGFELYGSGITSMGALLATPF
jgi:hypothetical protein